MRTPVLHLSGQNLVPSNELEIATEATADADGNHEVANQQDRATMEEPLLDRGAARSSGAGEDGDHEMGKRMKNVVSSSREGNADPSSSDIGEQIRDMQNNFLVGMTRDGGGLEEDLRRRSEGLQPAEGTSGTSRTRMKRSQSIVSLARDGAQSVLESTKSRGTVALLSFHVCLTALWAILGAFYYMWRLVSGTAD